MFAIASASVSPSDKQPGKGGTETQPPLESDRLLSGINQLASGVGSMNSHQPSLAPAPLFPIDKKAPDGTKETS